jgi:hypothetical protein
MVTLPNPDYLKEIVESPKPNGRDPGLDPKITHMVEFLDRALRAYQPQSNATVGTVTAAIGILLGRHGMNPDNLDRLIYDMTAAMRVGFYLHVINKSKGR